MKRFGEKLRTLRQRNGLTLRQLGKQLEVSNTFVLSLEQGKKTPSAAMVRRIADIFGVPADQLMRDELDLVIDVLGQLLIRVRPILGIAERAYLDRPCNPQIKHISSSRCATNVGRTR